jgi:cytochrome bd-type quinol oxidase subunit 1
MTLAAYAATGFAVAGIHAFMLRRDRTNQFHRAALAIALLVGIEIPYLLSILAYGDPNADPGST